MSQTAERDGTRTKGLRILTADEDSERLRSTGRMLEELGHVVTGRAVRVPQAAEHVAQDDPDLSVVVVHEDLEHALDLIEEISEFARGPVIALIEGTPEFLTEAAERGIDAFAHATFAEEVQGAIGLAIRRHDERRRLTAQVDQLETALERRGVIERAKGILMERHGIDQHAAFELLRDRARSSSARVVDLAAAVADGHALLPRQAPD